MQQNVGSLDRALRFVVGLGLIALALGLHDPANAPQSGLWWGWIGIIPLATSIFGTCPVYSLLGLSTCGKRT
jgi:hypothetical protein